MRLLATASASMSLMLASIASTGCIIVAGDFSVPEPDFDFEGDFEYEEEWNETPARNGRVRGDLGPVRNFDGETDEVYASAGHGWTSVTIETYDGEGRMGMIIFEMENDVRTVPSGTYVYNEYGDSDVGYIFVTGCSSANDTDYDAPASGGVIIVDNDGDDCDVEVSGDMPDGEGVTATASGSFTLEG